jgi:UDP-N-acetylmuramoyl-tripeptide--D-alanyl-D-alanine ligase
MDEIAEVTGGTLTPSAIEARLEAGGDLTFTAVTTDSRKVPTGSLFVALAGEKFDGHEYVEAARQAGAAAAMVSRLVESELAQIVVSDTLTALGQIANATRIGFAGPVVGVTGSVGKTTTKEFLALVLRAQFDTLVTEGNFNNEIGLPMTILNCPPEKNALVLEMGMRGLGQIAYLAAIGEPTIGVITNIGVSHIELLGSQEKIAEAKSELIVDLPKTGLAVFPATDAFTDYLRSRTKAKVLTVALEKPADLTAMNLTQREGGWQGQVATPWGEMSLFVPSPGRFNVLNALLAVAVGGHLGIPLDKIAAALATFTPPKMRLEIVTAATGATILSDAYNAAPDSMVGALMTLYDTPVGSGGKRIAVLGEMKELGEYAKDAHRSVGYAVGKVKPDMLVLVGGEMMQTLAGGAIAEGYDSNNIHYFDTASQAAEILALIVQKGDVLLVKGSRAMALEAVVNALTGGTG